MQPFVVNRHGRLVFPSNFIPELDFSVIDTEQQLIDVSNLAFHLLEYDPDFPRYSLGDIVDCTEDANIVDASDVWRCVGRSWRHLSWWMTVRKPEASQSGGSSDSVLITRIVNLRRADSCRP